MRSSRNTWRSNEREACRRFMAEDFRLIEPPELPQGGVFNGWDAPVSVGEIYRAIWDVELLRSEFHDAAGILATMT